MDPRIEQHIIGAYLSGRALPPEAQHLRHYDLAHPLAVRILSGIDTTRADNPSASVDEIITGLADRVRHAGVTPAVMKAWCQQTLPDNELAILLRYAIVLGVTKEIRGWGDNLAFSALNRHAGEEDSRHVLQHLDGAINRRYSEIAFAYMSDPDRIAVTDRFTFPDPLPSWEPAPAREEAEEQLLMHLVGKPGLWWAAASVVDESLFTAASRREVYRAIGWVEYSSDGGDDRVGAIGAEILKARSFGVANPQADKGPRHTLDLLWRIGGQTASSADCQEAIDIGRQLLSEDLRRSLTSADWSNGVPMRFAESEEPMCQPLMPPDGEPKLRP